MFVLTPEHIDPSDFPRKAAVTAQDGAQSSFIGRVRGVSSGRTVDHLYYEAYKPLAVKVGEKILNEAQQHFAVLDCRCAHRIGKVRPGDCSVWIEVRAEHRRDAQTACRYILEELKARLPVWKRECYADGQSQWLGQHTPNTELPSAAQETYYQRQLGFNGIGPAGQDRLRQATILVVGAGGLGSAALTSLAQSGVGTIGICESDTLEASNLHRQSLYSYEDIGQKKLPLAIKRLRSLNPFIHFISHPLRLDDKTIADTTSGYQLILDCTDNFATKYLLNDFAVKNHLPWIHASLYQWHGEIFRYTPKGDGGCLRCLWTELPAQDRCSPAIRAGVIGTTPNVVGHLQAAEAIKCFLNPDRINDGQLLLVNLEDISLTRLTVKRQKTCPACGAALEPLVTCDSREQTT